MDPVKGIAEYNHTAFSSADEDYFTVRMDHRLTDKDSFFARYTFDDGRNRAPNAPAGAASPTGTGVFWAQESSRNQFVTLETTHIFSPALLNSARIVSTDCVASSCQAYYVRHENGDDT